jgi:hypothetical protein
MLSICWDLEELEITVLSMNIAFFSHESLTGSHLHTADTRFEPVGWRSLQFAQASRLGMVLQNLAVFLAYMATEAAHGTWCCRCCSTKGTEWLDKCVKAIRVIHALYAIRVWLPFSSPYSVTLITVICHLWSLSPSLLNLTTIHLAWAKHGTFAGVGNAQNCLLLY